MVMISSAKQYSGALYSLRERRDRAIKYCSNSSRKQPECSPGVLAKNYFRNPSANVVLVAVIGTSGKTTTAYILESIFKEAGFECGVLGTINYRYKGKTFPAPAYHGILSNA